MQLKALFLSFFLLPQIIFAQLGKDSLTLNGLKLEVFSDGNIENIKDGNTNKTLNKVTQLWFSAKDSNDSLCVAAQQKRLMGRDFQPGPISNNPNARNIYNHVWKINKTTIDSFAAGLYTGPIPNAILDWPAHGNVSNGESYYLAPFVDVNNNGSYNPLTDGDYPCIVGDQAIFFIFNDDTVHTQTNALSLGVEVLGMAYIYSSASFLDSVAFVEYTIRNKKKELSDLTVAAYADFDLGNKLDDITGTFIDQNTILAYNSNGNDAGSTGFGINPPSTGLTVLTGVEANWFDGIDNNRDGCVDGVLDSNGICQILDSANNFIESWTLSSSITANNSNDTISGNPTTKKDYVNYTKGLWLNGNNIKIDVPSGFMNNANGTGFSPNSINQPNISYVYPGNTFDTTTNNFPTVATNWYESPNNKGDKQMVAGLGWRDTLSVGNELHVKIAVFMARDANTLNSYDAGYTMAQKINAHVDSVVICSGNNFVSIPENQSINSLKAYPNPAKNTLNISASNLHKSKGEIYTYNGRKVISFQLDNSGNKEINVSNLASGLYIIRIENKSMRFIITH